MITDKAIAAIEGIHCLAQRLDRAKVQYVLAKEEY